MTILRNTLIMMMIAAFCGVFTYIWLNCRGELQGKPVSKLDAVLFFITVLCAILFFLGLVVISTHWTGI